MRLITALLATTFALSPTLGEAQLLPAGAFSARDGRPGPGKSWTISDAQGTKLAAAINAVTAQTPIVIDYDHQTIRAEKNGMPAPAAGWILSAEWRPGKGMFAKVDWTDAAKACIAAKEYQYISPVILTDEATGEVTHVLLAALVNHPALLGMDAAVAQLATQFSQTPSQQESPMLLAALIAALGIPATATEAEALSAVSTLKNTPAKAVLPTALATALSLQPTASEAEALAALTALKTPDTTTLQTMRALHSQVVELTAQLQGDKVTKTVDEAIAAGKLLPGQREWALKAGRADMTVLQGYIDTAVARTDLNGQTGGKNPGGAAGAVVLSDTQKQIATQLGLDPAKYAESLKAKA